jgi:hypothetical protein
MTAKKPASRRTSDSELAKFDAHTIKASEYEELPELTEEMLERAIVNKGAAPLGQSPATYQPSAAT